MSEWVFDQGYGESFTITVEEGLYPTQIFVSSWCREHFAACLDFTEVLKNTPKIRAALKDCIKEIEREKWGGDCL